MDNSYSDSKATSELRIRAGRAPAARENPKSPVFGMPGKQMDLGVARTGLQIAQVEHLPSLHQNNEGFNGEATVNPPSTT